MIDFSTNKYKYNIQMKYLHGTYIYEKQQIKLFSSNSLLIDKLNLKIFRKILSQIGLFHLFCSPYLPQGSYRTSICLPFLTKFIQTSNCLADSHITHWFELLYKIPFILYFKHLQHFAKEICSSYSMSLPKPRPRLIAKKIA